MNGGVDWDAAPTGAPVDLPARSGQRLRLPLTSRVPRVDIGHLDWDVPLDDSLHGERDASKRDAIADAGFLPWFAEYEEGGLAEQAVAVDNARSTVLKNFGPDLGLSLFGNDIATRTANLGGTGPPGVAGYDTLQSDCKRHDAGKMVPKHRSRQLRTAPETCETHELRRDWFDALGWGGGDVEVIDELRRAELSRRVLLLHSVFNLSVNDQRFVDQRPAFRALGDALKFIHDVAPETVAEILLLPSTGAWMAHVLRQLLSEDEEESKDDLWVDVSHLWMITLVMHANAGLEFQAEVPLRDGRVAVPTRGLASFAVESPGPTALVRAQGTTITLDCGQSRVTVHLEDNVDGPGWMCLRQVAVASRGITLKVWLDDIDPFRNFGDPLPPERLLDDEFEHWTTVLQRAIEILATDLPETARAVARGMVSLTPVMVNQDWIWTTRSGSSGNAFGSAVIADPQHGLAMAEALVHEFQHNKFSALLHLVPLSADVDGEFLHAPWRDDPRPINGFLHGVYAFAGIANFWQSVRPNDEHETRFADFQFALWSQQLINALSMPEATALLTTDGLQFFGKLFETVEQWTPPQDAELDEVVELLVRNKQINWRVRHCHPDADQVAQTCRQILTQSPEPITLGDVRVIPNTEPWNHDRIRAFRDRYVFQHFDPTDYPTLAPSDIALVNRDFELAASLFAEELELQPGSHEAWAGLGLALHGQGRQIEADLLRDIPEFARALSMEHRMTGATTPACTLVEWLAGNCVFMHS
jgi:HEXXH motif-containing protein